MSNLPEPNDTEIYHPASATPPAGERFTPGALLAGRYRIVAALGKGGMGEVYRADDLTEGQSVALKFLPVGLAPNAAAGRPRVRPASLPLHRSGQRAPPARGDGGGQRLPDHGLAGRRPACGRADVAIRAAGGLIGIRQQLLVT